MSEWHERLKREVPRADIPSYLADLQGLVAALRRYRDDLRFPEPADLAPHLTPLLAAHPELTIGYVSDARYATIVARALGRG